MAFPGHNSLVFCVASNPDDVVSLVLHPPSSTELTRWTEYFVITSRPTERSHCNKAIIAGISDCLKLTTAVSCKLFQHPAI